MNDKIQKTITRMVRIKMLLSLLDTAAKAGLSESSK